MSGVYLQREEAFQEELAALKAENSSLRENISSLQDPATSVSIKMENDDHSDLIAQYQAVCSLGPYYVGVFPVSHYI